MYVVVTVCLPTARQYSVWRIGFNDLRFNTKNHYIIPKETSNIYKRRVWNAWEKTQNLKSGIMQNYIFYNPLIVAPHLQIDQIFMIQSYFVKPLSLSIFFELRRDLAFRQKKKKDYYKTDKTKRKIDNPGLFLLNTKIKIK